MLKEGKNEIKLYFQEDVHEVFTFHWNWKLLLSLSVRSSEEKRLQIHISFGD